MKYSIVLIFLCSLLAACGGGSGNDTPPVQQNNAPVAIADSVSVALSKSITIDVLANDTDAEDDSLSIASVSNVSGGTASIVSNEILFVADTKVGDFSFDYTVSDGNSESDAATVSLSVTAFTLSLSGSTTAALSNGTVTAHWGNQTVSAPVSEQGTYSIDIDVVDIASFIRLSAESESNSAYLESLVGEAGWLIEQSDDSDHVSAQTVPALSLNEARTALAGMVKHIQDGVPVSTSAYNEGLDQVTTKELMALIEFLLIANNESESLTESIDSVKVWLEQLDYNYLSSNNRDGLPYEHSFITDDRFISLWRNLVDNSNWLDASASFDVNEHPIYSTDEHYINGGLFSLTSENTFNYYTSAGKINGDYAFENDVFILTGSNGSPLSEEVTESRACSETGTLTSREHSRELVLLEASDNRELYLQISEHSSSYQDEYGIECDEANFVETTSLFKQIDFSEFSEVTSGIELALPFYGKNEGGEYYTYASRVSFDNSQFVVERNGLSGTWAITDNDVLQLDFSDGTEYRFSKLFELDGTSPVISEYREQNELIKVYAGMTAKVDLGLMTLDFTGRMEWIPAFEGVRGLGFTFQEDGKGFQSFNDTYPLEWVMSSLSQYTFEVTSNKMTATYTYDKGNYSPSFDNCESSGNECVVWRTREMEVIGVSNDLVYLINNQVVDYDLVLDLGSNPFKSGYIGAYKRVPLILQPL